MYNPFPLFDEAILNDRIQKGKRYFVRQSFRRGFQSPLKASFLYRAYSAEEKESAQTHLAYIAKDRCAFLYDARNPDHLKKLHIAASQPPGYKIYYAGREMVHWRPPREFDFKIRRYILNRHPNWWTKRGRNSIEVGLCEEWGELLLKLSFENEEEIIPFDEIEK